MSSTPSASSNSAVLTINLAALRENWHTLDRLSGQAATGAVVKANAYGLGIETVVPTLIDAGCRHFFVAHLSEAVRVRALAPDADIFVLNGFFPDTGHTYLQHQLTPVLGSFAEMDEWRPLATEHRNIPPVALHFDTGLNRLGFAPYDGKEIAEAHRSGSLGFPIRLVMSHFVESEIEGSNVTARQCAEFDDLRMIFKDIPASLCNSSGIFLTPDSHYDLVRSGYALYGGHPLWSNSANPMSPVIRLEAPIIQTRLIPIGDSVGYGGFWTAARPTRLACLSLGYADGLPRGSESTTTRPGGYVIIGGVKCAMLGRVSMDLLIVDATDAPCHAVQRGSMATIIGDGLSIDCVGDNARTIGYDILVSLGHRFERRVIDQLGV